MDWCYQNHERLCKVTLGVLGLQRHLNISGPLLRHTWAAIRAWRTLLPVRSRVPITRSILTALLVTLAARSVRETGRERELWMAAMLASWLPFEALLRPGEAHNLLVQDVLLPDAHLLSGDDEGLVLSLKSPKTRRVWRAQFVLVRNPALISWMRWWLEGKPRHQRLFRFGRRAWEKLVAEGLESL